MLEIVDVNSRTEYLETLRDLFMEYVNSLGFELDFQDYKAEFASLPGKYGAPEGALLLGLWNGHPAGCIAMRPFERHICEMKRMYVKPDFRGIGIARSLVEELIRLARDAGYIYMRLDTIEEFMLPAISLYRSFGFHEIPPYCFNPMKGSRFMELDLTLY